MANINIYVDEEQEREIKKEARLEGKSISKYCSEIISGGYKKEDGIINRESIEERIDKLADRLEAVEGAFAKIIKLTGDQNVQISEMRYTILAFLKVYLKDDGKVDQLITWAKELQKEEQKAR